MTALDPQPNRDERSRQDFASSLRAHVLTRLAGELRYCYEADVRPAFRRAYDREPKNGMEVHKVMKKEKAFRFYSAIRTAAQEMVFASVIPSVERRLPELVCDARRLREEAAPAGGSLQLNASLQAPKNVTEIDVHLAPGGYTSEFREDDVAAGAIYDNAIKVFAFRQFGEDQNDIGMTMANYLRLRYPEFRPQRILDAGCSVGHNTLPWAETFPDASVDAIDVAAPLLRYAAARAAARGVPVCFRQMDATRMDYPDESFDVVFSSMFLHELPIRDIRRFFQEAFRVLKPGGVLWNMELPPNSAMGAYEGFYLDWDSYYNNEPFYKAFRDQDYRELCERAGFPADAFIDATLPRYTFVGEDAFAEAIDAPKTFDSQTGRMDPKGTRWYGFGAWKRR